MLPAPGQGALTCEYRQDNLDTARALAAVLNNTTARAAVTAKRALLATLEAGCSAPISALAEVVDDLDDKPAASAGPLAAGDTQPTSARPVS